jgi:hypothetical protein
LTVLIPSVVVAGAPVVLLLLANLHRIGRHRLHPADHFKICSDLDRDESLSTAPGRTPRVPRASG